jgi:hypothetical protein
MQGTNRIYLTESGNWGKHLEGSNKEMTTFILKGCLSMKKYKTLTAVLIFVM